MTPFDQWYSSTIAPQLAESLKAIPAVARPEIEKASRESMAACWNAALDAAGGKYRLDELRVTP